MIRTQISFEREEYEQAQRIAARRHVSLAELCRRGLREAISREPSPVTRSKKAWMRHAGALCSNDPRSSESFDTVVYGRAEP